MVLLYQQCICDPSWDLIGIAKSVDPGQPAHFAVKTTVKTFL